MRSASSRSPTQPDRLAQQPKEQRTWFLRGSPWDDPVWILEPTSVLEEDSPVRLNWRFSLPKGGYFTDKQHKSLLESSRRLICVVRERSLCTGLAQRATTTAGHFFRLRELVRWMDQAGVARFADLDANALLEFGYSLRQRRSRAGRSLVPETVMNYLDLYKYLYRFRDNIGDGLRFDPFLDSRPSEIAGARQANRGHLPYTPDAIAAQLVQRAIALVVDGADAILQARGVYADAVAAANERGSCAHTSRAFAARALRRALISVPGQTQSIGSLEELARWIDKLYAACFVVISYLVGARASEILRLRAGCVQQRGDDRAVTVIVGSIFKVQTEYHGHPHEWVAPPPAARAISVLEALSAGHRAQTGRSDLWLRRCNASRATEWERVASGRITVISTRRIRDLIWWFAMGLNLPRHEGKLWKISTHQGRKTFARFAALRDSSAFFALAQHFGHRERAITEQGYAGRDYQLQREIDSEILEQSVIAWEHMLAAPGLGGRAGTEIMAKRPRFRGARLKDNLKSYARMLVEAGLTLGVCDWGFCVYREEYSACLGNAHGPNPVRREPSTCARCKNFVVSEQHRPYWVEQVTRNEALLNEPALPLQTIRIARERATEARSLLRTIDATTVKESVGANRSKR